MQLCPHGYDGGPCWMCDGLLDSEAIFALRELVGWHHPPNSRQCAAWYALPPDVEPRRNQDIPASASVGDYYRSQRGKAWLLCARGSHWSLVMRAEPPADVTPIKFGRQRGRK